MTPPSAPPGPAGVLADAITRKDVQAALAATAAILQSGPFLTVSMHLEKAVAAFPDEPGLALRLLELLQSHTDWIRYDAHLKRTLARFPDVADFRFLAGRGLEAREHGCAAIREYGRAARLDSEDLESVLRISHVFRSFGRPFLARRRLRVALKRHPDSATLHAAMAYAYIDDRQFGKAVTAFEKAVSFEPDDSPYLDDLGGALLLTEEWKQAGEVAFRSLKVRAMSEKAWTVFAVANRHLGNLERAERAYRRAMKAARNPSRARGNLGLFLSAWGPTSEFAPEAKRQLRTALDAHPDWDEVREALERLEG